MPIVGCGGTYFASYEQEEDFARAGRFTQDLRRRLVSEGDRPDVGALFIIDVSSETAKAEHIAFGDTAEAAMRDLLATLSHPCASESGGAKATIAVYVPHPSVALPIGFSQCAVLAQTVRGHELLMADLSKIEATLERQAQINRLEEDVLSKLSADSMQSSRDLRKIEVALAQQSQLNDSEQDALRKLIASSTTNAQNTAEMSSELSRVSQVQQDAWGKAMQILNEVSNRLGKP